MKSISQCLLLAALMALPAPVSAQLLPDQRVLDFQNLAALYAKRYAPYEWKRLLFGFDLFDIRPWIDRVRAAKNDLEFFEIQAEYVASLNDTHSTFSMTSSFSANLGMTVDLYDNTVLIDSINRSVLPVRDYPFQIGDELVSVDSIAAEEWIRIFSKWRRWGNPVSTRRLAAGQITFRSQSIFPRAAEIGASATVEIRRSGGNLERYTIPWSKSGLPVTDVGPVPLPTFRLGPAPSGFSADYMEALEELHQYKLPENDLILTPVPWATDEDGHARTFVNGIGARSPVFAAGLPPDFVQRLGRQPSDFHYSGTYVANGLTIGYLRIPSFGPPNLAAAVNELRTEIDYLQLNTAGLVVDVMRNPGGGCYMIDVAAHLIPYTFYFFGEQLRATQGLLNSRQALLDSARLSGAPQWVIDRYQFAVDEVRSALKANRGLTAPISACRQLSDTGAPRDFNAPASIVYSKPMIVLIDEFSISAADIFPAMIQDNKRAILVGARTSGGGGSVSGWPTGFYSESVSTNTNSLVVRWNPIRTEEFPPSVYIENVGVRPDIALNFTTKENLLNGGRPFVDQATRLLLNEIAGTR